MRLNLEERTQLEENCFARLAVLGEQGLSIPGASDRLVMELVTELLTPEQEAEAKERWLFWLTDLLDKAETEIRKRMIASGIVGTNGAHSR